MKFSIICRIDSYIKKELNYIMLISVFEKINNLNDLIFTPFNQILLNFHLQEWLIDAIVDSFKMLPFLFFTFIFIEVLEFYFADKIDNWIKKTKKTAPAIGGVISIIPQCCFSVMASSLYCRKLISKGCLIAIYLGTSDETIPILLASPEKIHLIIPIVGIKLFIAILMGYIVDLITDNDIQKENTLSQVQEIGCCDHNLKTKNKPDLIIHPIKHTANIFCFIFLITLFLNFVLTNYNLSNIMITSHKYLQCLITAFIGLIPNCAVSIAITMMLIKGTISFGAAISGLLSNAGLGLLVLIKNNKPKDTLYIICILLVISIFTGLLIEFII